jgi:DNA-binding NtrC family response regulator
MGVEPKKSILVVDDDLNLRRTLVIILRNAGYDVWFAENAAQGLLQLQTRKFDLLILDYKMPEMDGIDLLKTIKNLLPELPVFFLTGNGSAELEQEAWKSGVRGYMVKPADPERILMLVRTLCPVDP